MKTQFHNPIHNANPFLEREFFKTSETFQYF